MQNLEEAFRILRVSPGDDETTIRKAWRSLVREYHPDIARTDPYGANERVVKINTAFDAVSNCSSDEVNRLKAAIAKRELLVARMRRERLLREKQARKAYQAASENSQAQKSASATEENDCSAQHDEIRSRSTQLSVKTPVVRTRTSKRHRVSEGSIASLAQCAEQSFIEALKICTKVAPKPSRSVYM